jgi:hypothetical protein
MADESSWRYRWAERRRVRQLRRQARRELKVERRARGSKSGDVLATAVYDVQGDRMGGPGGGFGTQPGGEIGD